MDGAPNPVHWLIVEADAITNLDYTAARVALRLIDELRRRHVVLMFARASASLLADMARHGVTAAVGAGNLFATRHAALAAVKGSSPGVDLTDDTAALVSSVTTPSDSSGESRSG